MDIFCGIELDYYSMPVNQPYDYRIGSVHYLPCGEGYLSVVSNAETLLYQVSESAALARACGFSSIWTLTKNGSCEIPL